MIDYLPSSRIYRTFHKNVGQKMLITSTWFKCGVGLASGYMSTGRCRLSDGNTSSCQADGNINGQNVRHRLAAINSNDRRRDGGDFILAC